VLKNIPDMQELISRSEDEISLVFKPG
jgi:hypothetical protein